MLKLLTIIICIAMSSPIQASYVITLGKNSQVVFPHKQHQKSLGGCTDCHGSNTPGPIAQIGEKWVHDTCKGCHMESKAGPIECHECHAQI